MKPTTVYLPVQENIIFQTEHFKKKEGYFFTPEQLNEYTQNVIKQALETAAENVDVKGNIPQDWVDKESIMSTFEETFDKFKV